ncbi:MAG: DUF2071 domain-containing protein [Planctomycetota bacterium]|nr:DUF2071 domain-containing protein [Planctomycetota bacterium]
MFSRLSHRPWPLPSSPWVLAMTWNDLLFAHWPVAVDDVRRSIPPGLEVDTWEGDAWVGVVPFRMTGVRPRILPSLPGFSAFPELNVRTYVKVRGRPGVWFFSLDASSLLCVQAARWTYRLPYFHARMSCEERRGWILYESVRRDRRGGAAVFRARYRPLGATFRARPGTLDDWLVERYCLYAVDGRGRLLGCDIHHRPWELQRAEAVIEENGMTRAAGLELPDRAPVLHFARRLETVAWWRWPVHG